MFSRCSSNIARLEQRLEINHRLNFSGISFPKRSQVFRKLLGLRLKFIVAHICWKPRHVARQCHNKRVSATALTSLNSEAAAGSGVFHAVRRYIGTRRTHQSNCKKTCFLWGPPRGYIRRADGRQDVLGPGKEVMGRTVLVSECSSQAARTRRITLVRRL
jgi:hypothetical protein